MAKAVFFTLPHYGHINPNIGLVEELVKRGDQLICYSSIAFKEIIEATGAEFKEYKVDVEALFFKKDIPKVTATEIEPVEDNIPTAISKCFESVEMVFKVGREVYMKHCKEIVELGVDYIIYDTYAKWGMLFAHKLNIPSVCCESSFVMTEHVFNNSIKYFITYLMKSKTIDNITPNDINQTLNCLKFNNKRIQRKLGMKNFSYSGYFYSEYLNIVYLVEDIQPCIKNISDKFAFVGFDVDRFNNKKLINKLNKECVSKKDGVPLIYMSRGTIHEKEAVDIFNKCINVLGQVNCNAIISTGGFTYKNQFNNLPSNVKLFDFVDQKQILQDASIFITHGGITGVREAISNSVPMIFYPEATDQYISAEQIEKFGAGIWLKKRPLNCDELKYSVNEILNKPKYVENINALKAKLQCAGGYKKAADCIDNFKRKLNIL